MRLYKCVQCGNDFKSYNKNPKFCSLLCKGEFQAPPIDIKKLSAMYSAGMSQIEIGGELGVSQKSVFKAMKRHGIPARVAAKREQFGVNNSSWKGDKAGCAAFHRRLYAKYGKPNQCSECGTKDSNNYDYANLTGRYCDLDDYRAMCRSCHWKYDNKILNIKHMRDKLWREEK